MRTTLTIDDDLLDKAKAVAAKIRAPFRRVVNNKGDGSLYYDSSSVR